ncbi:hypothetical protein [Xylophilus ampelinus]|uniref:Histidine kinase n=1 Tax=Xylophilus ampelinus TaxID=54067 RepID=A0A318SWK9_9BURK|nr:hypothetical protein [Xylophilus ampelinus]MCS4509450.1 hypothetical protein [Xylophilus ampelinus]PYE79179.1 hypothetical protein DFQ15_103167 [Xylophilus ampelinus]
MSPDDRGALAPADAWHAAGVRHELLMRVLPAIRHDMAGPLSVVRMGNTVLRRYLGAEPFDMAQSLKRLGQTEEQLQLTVVGIRSLSRWDTEATDGQRAPADIAQAMEMARPMLDLYDMQLSESAAAPADWPEVIPGRVLYAVLGTLCYLQDSATAPMAIRAVAADGGLHFHRTPTGAAFDLSMRPSARRLQVDAAALQMLCADLRWPLDVTADRVILRAPTA